jgi:hypothetical protein
MSVGNGVFKGNGDSHQRHIDGRKSKIMIGTGPIDYRAFSDHIVQDGRATSATITLETGAVIDVVECPSIDYWAWV